MSETTIDPATWTDDDVDAHVTGSGAERSEWYWRLERSGYDPERFIVVIDDPHCDDSQITKIFTHDDFRRVAAEVLAGRHDANEEIRNAIGVDDLDAEAVDAIVQVIALGEISYG